MTQLQLKELFTYDNGIFTRINALKTGQGNKLGWTDPKGYRRIQIGNIAYAEHHLVWLYHYGIIPIQIDHINRVKHDNRVENLRLATTTENCRNQSLSRNNTSGQSGVTLCKTTKRWRARINIDGGIRKHIGWFGKYIDAVTARKEAEVIHGYSITHGKEAR